VKVVAAALLVVGCGRVGFDATASTSGDGGGGDGGGSGSGSDQSCTAPATRTIHTGDDLYGMLATLGPGEVVEVEAGTYPSPGFAPMTWSGTAAQPIVVRAAMGARPVLTNTQGNNNLDLYGSYWTLRGFELTGGDIGVRIAADNATLEDLDIHDVLDQGITCNRPGMDCSDIALRRVEIATTGNLQTGSGITLGCSDSSCAVNRAVVEGCYIHDTNGSAGAGIAVWKHTEVTVRDDVFVQTSGPAIVYQMSALTGRDIIERNFIWNVMNNGIQVEGQVIVRNNLVVGAAVDGIASRMQSGVAPVNVDIVHNTIEAATCVHSLNWSGTSYVVANNALQCGTGTNLTGTPQTNGNIGFTASDVIGSPNDYPVAGSGLVDIADPNYTAADDFNATARGAAPDVGAYERTTATNPGWIPMAGLKPIASDCP
jgi:hypothetical protein